MTPVIPLEVVYAGLGGTLLALIVATAQQKWQLKVFFLLALRLAIGWHFLFEGLHKIHSHVVGPTDTNRPFTSEPYFKVAPGPLGGYMRKQFDDPAAVIAARLTPTRGTTPEAFAALTRDEQAGACPPSVIAELDAMLERADEAVKAAAAEDAKAAATARERTLKAIADEEAKAVAAAKDDAGKAAAKKKADDARVVADKALTAAKQDAEQRAGSSRQIAASMIAAAKAKYARWVHGAEGRDAKVKFVTGDVPLTVPQRLHHIEWLRNEAKAAEDRQALGLGNGYGVEQKKAAELRTDLLNAEADLAKDANAFVAELKAELNGGKPVEETLPPSMGKRMDQVTMWFIAGVGACLMLGLLTRLSCVLAAGFLVTTYLLHPPFPWFPLPPGTEGNPVFVNKNVIEALALLSLACMPTGRWLGLDALLSRVCCRRCKD